ncbi:MAG: aspartokinase [Mariniflexile sp.]|jgi:aspartokinase
MKTVSSCVEDILITQPYLEEALSRNIINFSALAIELTEPISKMLKKEVKPGAIMMALRRYNPPPALANSVKMKKIMQNLGDITVRSNLTDFTIKNSETIIDNHAKILERINQESKLFYTFTRGIHESNIIISSSLSTFIEENLKNESFLAIQDGLSAISVNLPQDNSKIAGLYYQFFKRLAWEGIVLYEVISTTNEFTILVEDEYVDKAFTAIKKVKA